MSSAAATVADDEDGQQQQRQPLPADPDWLSGVIGRLIDRPRDAVTVIRDRTVATPAVSDPHNVLSSIVAVHIVYTVEGVAGTDSLDVVIKSLPQEPYSRAFVLEAQFDYREVHFYNTVGPPDYIEPYSHTSRFDYRIIHHTMHTAAPSLRSRRISTRVAARCFTAPAHRDDPSHYRTTSPRIRV